MVFRWGSVKEIILHRLTNKNKWLPHLFGQFQIKAKTLHNYVWFLPFLHVENSSWQHLACMVFFYITIAFSYWFFSKWVASCGRNSKLILIQKINKKENLVNKRNAQFCHYPAHIQSTLVFPAWFKLNLLCNAKYRKLYNKWQL